VKSVCQSWLGAVVWSVNALAALTRSDDDESRDGDKIMRLEQPIDRGLRDEIALAIGEARHAEFRGGGGFIRPPARRA